MGLTLFAHDLGLPVRLDSLEWTFLRNRNHVFKSRSITVHCGAGAVNESVDTMSYHTPQQSDGASDVVMVILQRDDSTFRHGLESCEMNHGINPRVVNKDLIQAGLIRDVGLVELHGLPRQLFKAVEHLLRGIAEVVDHNNLEARFEQIEDSK